MLKDLQKSITLPHIIFFIGLSVFFLALFQYSTKKNSVIDGATGSRNENTSAETMNPEMVKEAADAAAAQPAAPAGENEEFASVAGSSSEDYKGLPPSCNKGSIPNPDELLPKDANSQWARLNPSGNSDMQNVNLLKAGYHTGIDTVGNTLRNANLQVRSEPPNPTTKVSIWNTSTIEPDLMRVPLQIGCGPQ